MSALTRVFPSGKANMSSANELCFQGESSSDESSYRTSITPISSKSTSTTRDVEKQHGGSSDLLYSSSWARESLPELAMPEHKMPKEVAYRLIKDQLNLDGNPSLNLATFATTYMEEEAENLMVESLAKNFIDLKAYPRTADIERKCVNMVAGLYHAPMKTGEPAVGTSTLGSSEAIMLCTLAMKKRWMKRQRLVGKDYSRPNIITSSAVQVCWQKAARYFEVEIRYVYCTKDRYVLDPETAISLVDENTIGICCILGTTYTGHYEDVKSVNDLLVEKGLDVPIHVDAASGGFVAPFMAQELEWDFRVEKVVSINVSGHKYGLVYPGVGWAIWRSQEYLPEELVFNLSYLGTNQASFTLNFTKGPMHVIGQYYQFIRLGRAGYHEVMTNISNMAIFLTNRLRDLGFIIMSDSGTNGVPLVAFRIDPKLGYHFDEFSLAHQLRQFNWLVPAYNMAAHVQDIKLLRIVCRNDFSRNLCDALLTDIRWALETLKKTDRETVRLYAELERLKLAAVPNEDTMA